MKAWGFEYVTVAFNWIKIDSTFKPMMGVGNYTRPSSEPCLLGARGRIEVADHGVHQVILSPRRERSRKPEEQYDRIERLFPKASYLEMFARTRRKNRDVWGNQTETFGDVSERATLAFSVRNDG
jgi:N6-adenosine-specific RNA methylase IME4